MNAHNIRRGSALIVTIMITAILMIIGLYLLEKIFPISQGVKGIENSNVAYYQANSAVEVALFSLSGSNPGLEPKGSITTTTGTGTYSTNATGSVIPISGYGNSDYDPSYNRIAPGQPVQLALPKNIASWGSVSLKVRVPNTMGSLSGATSTPIINWSIVAKSGSGITASGGLITISDINNTSLAFGTSGKGGGVDLDGNATDIDTFYSAQCTTTNYDCSLKLSVINTLDLSSGNIAPYLEYKLTFPVSVPQQYAIITADGYASNFKQTIVRKVRQSTTNEALDFTVFQ